MDANTLVVRVGAAAALALCATAADGQEGAGAALDSPGPPREGSPGILDRLRFELDFRYMYGDADGALQTPRGGAPGTTSPGRPTLDEIGVDDVHVFDVSLASSFDRHVVTLGAQIVRMDGSATLGNALMSQGTPFPAGTSVESDVQLDWYRLGYQYEFVIDLDPEGQELRLAPGVQGVLLDFDFQLDGTGDLAVDRSYAKPGVRVGGTAEWLMGGPLSLELSGWWGIPLDKTAEILTVSAVVKWQLWGDPGGAGGAACAGVAHQEIEYEDDQTVPNHLDVELGPLLTAGVEIAF